MRHLKTIAFDKATGIISVDYDDGSAIQYGKKAGKISAESDDDYSSLSSNNFNWTIVGLDLSNTQYNPQESILDLNTLGQSGFAVFNNVDANGHIDHSVGANDEVEWFGGLADLGFGAPSMAVLSPPMVDNGSVYFSDLAGFAYKYSSDGELKWATPINDLAFFSAIGETKAFFTAGGAVYALDKETGDILSRWDISEFHTEATIFGAPSIAGSGADETLFIGLSSDENVSANGEADFADVGGYTFHGGMISFNTSVFDDDIYPGPKNVSLNEANWVFNTGDDVYQVVSDPVNQEISAGSTFWMPMSIDIDRGALYVGIGQNFDSDEGLYEIGKTPLSNPLSDSIISIDTDTGELRWSYQVHQNDFWGLNSSVPNTEGPYDWDLASPPVLFSIDGDDYVAIADKASNLVILNLSAIDRADENGMIDLSSGPVRLDTLYSTNQVDNDNYLKDLGILVWQKDYPGGDLDAIQASIGLPIDGQTALAYNDGVLYMSKHDDNFDYNLPEPLYLYALDVAGIVRGEHAMAEDEPAYDQFGNFNITSEYVWDDVIVNSGNSPLLSLAGGVLYQATLTIEGLLPGLPIDYNNVQNAGVLRGFDAETGELLFEHIANEIETPLGLLPSGIFTGATIVDGKIYIGFGDLVTYQGGLKVLSLPEEGTNQDDFITGRPLNNLVDGGNGNDVIYGGSGDDELHGGNGDDAIYGETDNDLLTGDNGNDFLYGGAGDDTLQGGRGNDILSGDIGNDIMSGGLGDDVFTAEFFLDSDGVAIVGEDVDTILDFDSGDIISATGVEDFNSDGVIDLADILDYATLTVQDSTTTLSLEGGGSLVVIGDDFSPQTDIWIV